MAARTFHVIAHRGDSAHAPENTFAAFDLAVALPADGIETDAQVSKDGVAVLIHDLTTRRTAGKDAPVGSQTLDELRGLDAGSWMNAAFAQARIPTLDDALAKYLDKITFNMELKGAGSAVPVVAALQKYAGTGAFERIMVTSFKTEWLAEAKRLDPRCHICPLIDINKPFTLEEARALQVTAVSPHQADLTAARVDAFHQRGITVLAWGVKNLEAAKHVVETGADGCTYDDPGELLAYLKERGLRPASLPLLTQQNRG
jgi:glycerophosphoryl diester phosphodiesterase